MKLSVSLITAAAVLSPLVAADFDLYYQKPTNALGGVNFWQAVDDQASTDNCQKMVGTRKFERMPDVSGKNIGFRCAGTGCFYDGNVDGIQELEMNFGFKGKDVYHFTIRQWFREDNKWWLVGVDDKVYGHCSPWTEKSYDCVTQRGQQKFACKVEGLSATDINNDINSGPLFG
ncbi:hypothetical protein FZEAL_7301 [Fusarium zealandicum]|uniref:Uncharacterized protein n=1 Tax=Fusarium zealandicum TaxID=1053134 RepID=A0A8H4UGS6_9HYPO|nr:hypothetical protein FZEAL_7301 [Fusarium zealandicum]